MFKDTDWLSHLLISYNLMQRMKESSITFSRALCFRQ